jgi:hypothetical protein
VKGYQYLPKLRAALQRAIERGEGTPEVRVGSILGQMVKSFFEP